MFLKQQLAQGKPAHEYNIIQNAKKVFWNNQAKFCQSSQLMVLLRESILKS